MPFPSHIRHLDVCLSRDLVDPARGQREDLPQSVYSQRIARWSRENKVQSGNTVGRMVNHMQLQHIHISLTLSLPHQQSSFCRIVRLDQSIFFTMAAPSSVSTTACDRSNGWRENKSLGRCQIPFLLPSPLSSTGRCKPFSSLFKHRSVHVGPDQSRDEWMPSP